MTTLLFIDDPNLSLELQRRLGKRDIKVVNVSSGSLAMEMIRKLNPSMIILGYELQDLPGSEVHRHIKKDPETNGIPLIILHDPKQGQVDALPQGPHDEVMSKPVDIDDLVKRIAGHMSIALRRNNRTSMKMQVQYNHGTENLTGIARNISESGIFLETDTDLQKGSELTLSVTLPGQSSQMEIAGRVAHRIELNRDLRFGLGIQFTGLEPGSRDRILDFLVQKSFQIIA